jgi:hypothetical protein
VGCAGNTSVNFPGQLQMVNIEDDADDNQAVDDDAEEHPNDDI